MGSTCDSIQSITELERKETGQQKFAAFALGSAGMGATEFIHFLWSIVASGQPGRGCTALAVGRDGALAGGRWPGEQRRRLLVGTCDGAVSDA